MPKSYLVSLMEGFVQVNRMYRVANAKDWIFWQAINNWRNGTLPEDLDAEITNIVKEFIDGLCSST